MPVPVSEPKKEPEATPEAKDAKEGEEAAESAKRNVEASVRRLIHAAPGNGGRTEKYVWTQSLPEVTVTIDLPSGTKAKMLDVKIGKVGFEVLSVGPHRRRSGEAFRRHQGAARNCRCKRPAPTM